MRGDHCIDRGLRVEVVGRFLDRHAARFREASRRDARVLRVRIDAGAYRGAAEWHPRQLVDRATSAADRLLDLARVALEFLAEADRSGVLEMCAPGLDHRPELLAFRFERALQTFQRGDELVLDRHRGGELDRGRDDVVR